MKRAVNTSLICLTVLIILMGTPAKAQYCTATSFCSEYIYQVTLNTINNTSSCSSGYADYTGLSTTLWMGSTYSLSVGLGNPHFATVGNVWVDWNNNQSFADPGERLFASDFTTSTGTVNFTVPYTGANDTVRMRVRTSLSSVTACGALTWGESEDYTIILAGAFGCSGTPAAATTLTSANPACYGQNFTLSLSTAYNDTAITYQWQSSPDNLVWSDIAGANALNYTGAQTIDSYYRCIITCVTSGQFVESTILFVPLDVFTNCYCTPGTTNNTNGQEITNVTFAGINNTTGATGVQGYANFSNLPPANVTQYATVPLSVTLYNGGLLNYCVVWIDWNQNGLFETSEFINMGSGNYPIVLTTNVVVPGNAVPGPTRMRVRVRDTGIQPNQPCSAYTWGETEDYSVGVTAAVLCTGFPASASTIASDSSMCQGVNLVLSLSTVYQFGGNSFQWQSSPDGITFSDINGATNETYVTQQTVATFYQCIVTCTNGGGYIKSTPVEVLQNNAATCFCIPPVSSNPGSMWITNVTSSGCASDINNSSPATGTIPYVDYSASQIISQVAGLDVTLSFSSVGYALNEVVWVDFNDNGYFTDPGELVLTINNTAGAMTTLGSFTIPGAALAGTHQMRVRGEYYTNSVPNNPCNALQYGETEDYGLNVITCSGPPAMPGAIVGNVSICNGTTNIYSVAPVNGATTYTWTLPGGWSGTSITDTISIIATTTGGIITVTANNNCGSSSAQTLTVSINSVPATPGPISGAASVCTGSNAVYFVAPVNGASSYSWTLPAGWSGTSTVDSILAIPTSTGGNITVTAINFCGSSSAQTLTVSVSSIPAIPGIISGLSSICSGSSNTYNIVPVSGASSYSWTLPSGWTGTSTTNSILTIAAATGGDITVMATNFCGTSSAQLLNVSVISVPSTPVIISGASAVCAGSTNVYSVAPVAGASTYTWTLPPGWTGFSTADTILSAASASSGIITVTADNFCGSSSAQTVTITTISIPSTPGVISGPAVVCENSLNTYIIDPVMGATSYSWTLPPGWSGSGITDTISVMAQLPGGTISVVALNGCGSSLQQSIAINVNALPVVTLMPFITVCENAADFILTGGLPSGGNYTGTGISSNNFSPSSAGAGVHLITYSYTDANNCSGSDTASIEVILCTGIQESSGLLNEISILPNPFTDKFSVSGIHFPVLVSVYTMEGMLIRNEQITVSSVLIDLSSFPPGMYFVKLVHENDISGKIIIKN